MGLPQDADGVPAISPPLSERAKRRLQIAAAMLRSQGVRLDVPRNAFYDAIQKLLWDLPVEQRVELRTLVDWVEAYERTEDGAQPPTSTRVS